MSFVAQLKTNLKDAMKAKDAQKKDWLRSVIAEFERQNKKEFSDDEVYKVIKSMIKLEKERMEAVSETDGEFLGFLQAFLPQQATAEEVEQWVVDNVDFSKFKNKMQAMGQIMKHFGNAADGKMVKGVLEKIEV
jgi:uncharacterized protein YqeY